MQADTIAALAATSTEGLTFDHAFGLRLGDSRINVQTNHGPLGTELRDYFGTWVGEPHDDPDLAITAAEREAVTFDVPYRNWDGEPGEQVKESFANLEDGRVVHKSGSGLQFLLGDEMGLMIGSGLGTRQVIRFISLQYESWRMARGSVLCHAAGVAREGVGITLGSCSGSGKTTTALHVMSGDEGMDFVSNDRVLLERVPDGSVRMRGVPKHPRVNPGTALNNPDLVGVLPPQRRKKYEAMERNTLWEIDKKFEVRVEREYGPDRTTFEATLRALFILSWSHKSDAAVRVSEVVLRDRQDLLQAIMKHPGPFHLPPGGPLRTGTDSTEPGAYLDVLEGIPTFELAGGLDFDRGVSEVAAAVEKFS